MSEISYGSENHAAFTANINVGRQGRPEFVSGSSSAETREEQLQVTMEAVADQLIHYSLEVKRGDKLLIQMAENGWQMAAMVKQRAEKLGATVILRNADSKYVPTARKVVLEAVADVFAGKPYAALRLPTREARSWSYSRKDSQVDPVKRFIEEGVVLDDRQDVAWANKVLVIREASSDTSSLGEAEKIYLESLDEVTNERLKKRWSLIYAPNQEEAQAANMDLLDYAEMYYQACDRDWVEVERVQDVFIEMLKQYQEFSVVSAAPEGMDPQKWSTTITMSIEGMVGANSYGKGNMPGSEVFLAPVRGTLEGQYALPYPVRFGKRLLPNIGFKFEAGKVVDFWIDNPAEGDEEYVRQVLASPGADEVGELGIGTNPSIDRAVPNTLLVEKASPSIHLALGKAYEDKVDEKGRARKTDNGVRSQYHIDLTRMLTAQWGGGKIIVSKKETDPNGNKIQKVLVENGRYVDPEFAIFNKTDQRS